MLEILLLIIAVLLGVICILGFGILFNVSQTKISIASLTRVVAGLHDIRAIQYKERFELIVSLLEQLVETSVGTDRNTSEIKAVTDVIYRYKLPNAAERKVLDEIEIDNEVSNGILNSGGQ